MVEGLAGTYTATLAPLDVGGTATIEMSILCPGSSTPTITEFDVYIDPSGWVRTVGGSPIVGATVKLYRSDSASGPFEMVSNGSAIMSPQNRTNPDTTDADGHFGWDVIAGYYKVRAEKAGCTLPNSTQTYVESRVMEIPPPVFDLDLRLDCGPEDTTAPNISITTPANDAKYKLNEAVNAAYSCRDSESTVTQCSGTVANGLAINTGSIGSKSFKVDAMSAGGTSSLTHNYNVVYNFSGFRQPVDPMPTVNSVKAGSAVPVKFSLSGNQGLSIFAAGFPKSTTITCGSSNPVDGIEETVTAGSSSLSYDASIDQYTYVWKTDKGWAGTCRQLVLQLADGEFYRANFQLLK